MFIFPYNKDNAVENTPWVIIGLMIVNSFLLILTWLAPSRQALFESFGFTPAHFRIYTIFTSMFLHVGFFHLFGNMWFLWMFGKRVENTAGPWLFGLIYLACGVGGDGLHYALNRGSSIPSVGASGAISGIAGCFFVLFPNANFDLIFYLPLNVLSSITLKTIHTHTHAAVGAWIAEQTLLGLLAQVFGVGAIAFWAHVGGFAVGAAFGCAAVLVMPTERWVAVNRETPQARQGSSDAQKDEFTKLKL